MNVNNKVKKDLIIGKVYDHEVVIPHEVVISSCNLAYALAKLLGQGEAESSLASYWSLEVCKARLRNVLELLPNQTVDNVKLLEVGCGLGLFVCVGHLLGLSCVGIEPGEEEYQGSVEIARQVLRGNGLADNLVSMGHGERLGFPDDSFDVVCTFQTIEHVDDPELMIKEIHRVLKPGGLLFLQCPNYQYAYEPHYGLILPCFMGKKITEICLRLYRRPSQFLANLNFITPRTLRDFIRAAGFGQFSLSDGSKHSELQLPIEVYYLPFKFTRGLMPSRLLSALLRLTMLKQIFKIYPQITLIAWKNT